MLVATSHSAKNCQNIERVINTTDQETDAEIIDYKLVINLLALVPVPYTCRTISTSNI